MNLIVIGASGFVGRHVLLEAVNRGYNVLGTQSSAMHPKLLTFNLLNDGIADCLPRSLLTSNEEVYAVICSAVANMSSCASDKNLSYKINVTKTIQLIEELNNLGINSMFLSTGAVYDGETGYYDESVPTSPINDYGRQKTEVENHILAKYPENMIARLSKAISDDPCDKHLLSEWYAHIDDSRPIRCVKDETFTPTSVYDISRAVIESVEKKLNGVFHIVSPETFTRDELARLFLDILNSDLAIKIEPVESFNFPEKRPRRTHLNGAKFEEYVGTPFTPIKNIIESFCYKLNFMGKSTC